MMNMKINMVLVENLVENYEKSDFKRFNASYDIFNFEELLEALVYEKL